MAGSHERKEAEAAAAAVTEAGTPKKEKKDKKDKKDKRDKDEKKDRKEKKRRSETDGVHKESKASDKKEKKHKKEKLVQALDAHLQASAAAAEAAEADDSAMADAPAASSAVLAKRPKGPRAPRPIVRGALVEFARPLAEDKYQKKVLKMVKLAAKQQALLRGVKEVNKALRKAPAKNPSVPGSASAGNATAVPGIVVVAGDVNPAEVVMHLPLACEDVNAPYVFVASRGELGQAARTKRPTSVVMLKAEGRTKKGGAAASAGAKKDKPATAAEDSDDEDDDEAGSSYPDLYRDFVKTVQKEYAKQMKGII